MTSLVMFHPFHDILAVSDGKGVGIWSLSSGTRILQIPNTSPCTRHTLLSTPTRSGGGGQWTSNPYQPPPGGPPASAPVAIHPSTSSRQQSHNGTTQPLSHSQDNTHHNYHHPRPRDGQTAATMFVRGAAVEQIARHHSQSRHPSIGSTPSNPRPIVHSCYPLQHLHSNTFIYPHYHLL